MTLTQEHLEAIEKHASLFMSPQEVALIVGVEYTDFQNALRDSGHDIHKSYYRGLYLSISQVRETIIGQAKSGSNPAQTQTLKFLEETLMKLPK